MRTKNLGKIRYFTALETNIDDIFKFTGYVGKEARFDSEKEVLEYFTVENMINMFGECEETQSDLDEIASLILASDNGTFTTFKNIDAELTAEEALAINTMKTFQGLVKEGENWLNRFPSRDSKRRAEQALEWLREDDGLLAAEDEIELAQICLSKNL